MANLPKSSASLLINRVRECQVARHQFLSLGHTQACLVGQGAIHIAGGLAYSILNGLRRDLELSGKLGWRPASANQLDYLLAEFSRIGRMCFGHRRLLKIKILSVHEKKSSNPKQTICKSQHHACSSNDGFRHCQVESVFLSDHSSRLRRARWTGLMSAGPLRTSNTQAIPRFFLH
jgi:hypothetical protein